MSKHKSRPRLSVELLEPRCTPTVWGNAWPDPEHLTLSFAPDGTAIGTQQSTLYSLLDNYSVSAWQYEALRAWQTWAVQTNMNIGIVGDGGQALGTAGLAQGDTRFGDIRLTGVTMSKEVGAISSPFEAAIGTWAGDVKLNDSYTFGSNGQGQFDLFSVFLHEAGHTLGLGPTSNTSSVRCDTYQGAVTGLGAVDITELRALYGTRTPDDYEGAYGNESFGYATKLQLKLLDLDEGIASSRADGDLTTTNDTDYYSFKTLANLTGTTVRLQTKGLSLVAPRLSVYNSSKKLIATVSSPGPNSGNLEVRLPISVLTTYYVKVESDRSDAFGIGSYTLKVDNLPCTTGLVQTTGGVVDDVLTLLNNDLHTDDTFVTASLVPAVLTTTNSRFDFAYKASISDSLDVDIYKIKAPTPPAGSPNVMTVMAWGLTDKRLDPMVTVYNSSTQVVPSEVLVDETGKITVQVANATAGANYYVKVAAAQPTGLLNFGNYFVGVDFGTKAVSQTTFANEKVTQALPQEQFSLSTRTTQMHHFVLSTSTANAGIESALRMTIFDADGNALLTRVVKAGQTASFDFVLAPGTYNVRFNGGTKDKSKSLPNLDFTLRGFVASDPVGPKATDPTMAPSGGDGSPPVYTGGGGSQASCDPYGDPYSPA